MIEKGQRVQLRDAKQTVGTGIVTNISPDVNDKDVEEMWK